MQFALKRKALVVLCALMLSVIMFPAAASAGDDADDSYVVSLTAVSKDGASSVAKVSGGGEYSDKEKATVIAYPRVNYVFCGWYDAADTTFSNSLSDSADYTFSVTKDRDLVALYERNTSAFCNLEVFGSKYMVNNSSQIGSYSKRFNSGEKMFLSYTDDAMEFRYWVDKSGNIVSTAKDYSFILSGDTSILAYYTPLEDHPDRAVVYFRNAYNQLFSTRTYSVSDNIDFPNLIPIKMGSVFKGWYIADANGNPSKTEATTESIHAAMVEKNAIVIVPDYYESNELYTLNIEYTDGDSAVADSVSESIAIGEVKVVNAPEVSEYTFAYWMLEDQIISYDKKVSIRRGNTDTVTLKAVYSKEAVEQDALVAITQMFSSKQSLSSGDLYVISTIMQFYVPNDCVLSKSGFVYGTNGSLFGGEDASDNLVLGGADVYEKESGISQRRGIYTYNLTTSDPGRTLYIRAYLVYKDKDRVLHTIYTDVRSCSYKSMNGVTCKVTFLGDQDSVLQSTDVLYGSKPVYEGDVPEKQADDEFTYTFAGWTPAITFATEDAVYKAVFEAVPIPAPEPPAAEVTSAAAKENIQLTNIADMSPDTKTVRAVSALYAFKALDPAADVAKYYDGWKSDFRVSFDRNIEVGSFGFYGAYDGYGTGYEAAFLSPASFSQGEALMLLQAAGLTEVTYYDVHKNIEEFICGVFNLEESNLGTKMRVELVIWEDGTDASEGIVIAAEEYTFDAVTQLDCIHSFGEWAVTTEPTCTKTGVETRVCEYCGETETRDVEKKQHTPAESHTENVIPATCTSDGSYDVVVRCAVCKEIIYSNSHVIPKYPSVEVSGLDPRTDVILNDIHNGFAPLPKSIAHLNAECLFNAIIPEEATYNAYKDWMCDYRVTFDDSFENGSFGLFGEYSGYGNDYSIAFLFPNDAAAGECVYLLQAAGLGEVTYNDMLNNIESFDCGLFNVNAANVGKLITVELVIWNPADGSDTAFTLAKISHEFDSATLINCIHSFGDWSVTTESTCTKTGVETRVCKYCGETETRDVDKKLHTPGESHIENEIAATCSEDGSYDVVVRCAVCKEIIYSNNHVIPKYPSVEVTEIEPRADVILNDINNGFETLPKMIGELNSERLFGAIDPEQATFDAYKDWMCDYRVTFNDSFEKDSFGLFGEYSGYGNDYSIAFLFPNDAAAGESVYLLQAAGLGEVTYNDMLNNIESFDCGLFNVNAANVGKSITVELVIWNAADSSDSAFTLASVNYTFDSTTVINCIHSFGNWELTTKPSCTEAGEETRICEHCGISETREVSGLGHDLVHHDAKAPTCSEIGWEAYDTCSRCDYTTYVEIPALDHDLVHHNAQAATCTEKGWNAYDTCSRCDYTTYVEIPALDHDLVHHNAQAANCTEKGWNAYDTCSRCDYTTYVEIPALDHDLVHHDAKAPTCTEIGWEAYDTCSRCDYTTYVELPALDHDLVHHNAQAANCTEIGWNAYDTCSRCDYTTYVEIPALDHNLVHHDAKAPTCTEIGWEAYDTCSRCDYTTYVEIPAVDHDLVHHDAKAPTCTEIGWNAYDTCSRCDYTTYVEIPALDHNLVHHDAKAPTCTEIGWEAYDTCSRCDYTTYVEIPALNHDLVHHDAQAPTCTEIGWEAYDTCSRCDYTTYVEIPALDHDLVHHDAKAPTCTEIGWNSYDTCSRCDYTTCVEIPALDHDLVHHNAQAATCTEIGWNAYDTCSRCDYTTYVEIPALDHDLVHHDAKAPTCTEIGWEAYDTCSRCDYTTYVEIPALDHDLVHHDAKAPTCTEIGWEAYDTCSRCDFTTYVEIPALDHNLVHHDAKAPTCTEIGWEAYDTCSRCDYTTYVEIPALDHDLVHHNAQAATCTEKGWNAYDTCSRCDYTTYVEIPALDHDLVHHDAKAPTCTEIGREAYDTCSRCDYTTCVEIPALNHDLVHHNAQAATCTEKGWNAYDTCSRCDYTTYVEIPALEHNLVHHNAQAATCTEIGWNAYDTCSRCDYSTYVEIPALDHDIIHHEGKAPTCTEIGWNAYDTCSRCDYTTYVELPALDHNLVHHNAQAATCTEIGWNAYDTCSRCDYTTYVEIPALNHDLVHHDAQAPTCTEIGWNAYDTCSRCDYTTYVEIPALDHDLVHHNAQAATCTEIGWEAYDTCSRCDYTTYVEIPALDHDLVHYNAQTATCTEIGWEAYDTCSRCDYTTYVEIPALDHNLVHHNAQAATCTEIGWNAYDTCSRCDYTTYVEIPALNHDLVHHDAKAPACTEIGWEAYDTCSRCDYTTYVEIPALDHDLVHHDAQAPTCTEIGWEAYDTCSRCDYTTYEEIPALGHDIVHHDAKAATCTEIGWEAYDTCSRCDYTTYVEISALDHDLVHHDAKAPTCTEIGWNSYDTCSRCDYTTYVEIPALNHDVIHHEAQAATCTEKGWNAYDTCSRCDYTTYVEIPALNHDLVHHNAQAATCTEIGWNAYDTCSRCDYSTYVEIPALGHEWNNPAWTWDGLTSATATFVCKNNSGHSETRVASGNAITSEIGSGENAGYMVYTATVTFENQKYSDTTLVQIISSNSFTHSDNFAHVDSYLYRVGNGNALSLGTLFKAVDPSIAIDPANVKIKVAAVETNSSVKGSGTNLESGSTAKCVYTKNSTDWTQSTLKFTGEGPVKVTIKVGEGEEYDLNLEVVTGNNFVNNATLSGNANIVLLGNVKVGASTSTNSALTLNGKIIFGNGFEIDCSGSNISSKAFGIISLTNSSIDNAIVKGPTYTSYSGTYGSDNYAGTIVCYDNAVITNCRISGAADPVCVYGTNVKISDTILSGGVFANLHIRNRGGVTVSNLTTINTQNSLAIVFYLATDDSYIVINGTLIQHNFIANNATMSNDKATTLKGIVFNNNYSRYHFNNGSIKYANMGIISMDNGVGANVIFDNRSDKKNYTGMNVSLAGVNGYVYTMENTDSSMLETDYIESEYIPSVQNPYDPAFSWAVPSSDNITAGGDAHCFKDSSGILQIQFVNGSNKTINPSNYATFKKYQGTAIEPVSITCMNESNNTVNPITDGRLVFDLPGTYTIKYQYNGVPVYDKNLGKDLLLNYTKTITVNVSVKKSSPNAEITSSADTGTIVWGKNGSTFDPDYNPCIPFLDGLIITDYDFNGNAYTVLDGNNQSKFIKSIASVSVSGTNVTIVLANGTKLVVKGPGVDGSVQIKTYNNKLYYCDSTADDKTSAFTKTFAINSYTYTGENGASVSYGKVRSFTSTTSTSTIANYSSLGSAWSNNKFLMFDAQGGVVSPSYASESPATLPTPTRDGFTFLNWNTKADGTGTARSAGSSMTFSSNTSLYAIWAKNVIVYFDGNGGTDPDSISAGAGTSNTLPVSVYDGVWLEGWYTSAGDGTKIGNGGETFTMPNVDTTYYAHWSPKLSVVYSANGGTVNTDSAVYEGTALILPTPSYGVKTFEGWFTAEEGGIRVGTAGDSYVPSSNITLYAQWSDNILVTFYANGGTAGTNSASYDNVTPVILPAAARPGHRFDGWFTDAVGGESVGSAGDEYVPAEPVTLHAHWTAFKVTYEANGGSVSPANASAGNNGSVTLPTPTRTGYTFNGWFSEASGGAKIGNGGASYTPTGDITIHAQWTINSYKITITTSNSSTAVTVNGTTVNSGGSVTYDSVVKVVLSYTQSNSLTFTVKQGNDSITRYSNEACTTKTTSTAAGTYYFRMPAGDVTINSSSVGGSSSCIPSGTMITLADGSKKPVEQISMNDRCLVFNHETGTIDTAGIIFFEADGVQEYNVVNLAFSDGSTTRLIYEHGYFDMDLMKYVYIREDNYTSYIGHKFYKGTYNGTDYNSSVVTLTNAWITTEVTGCFSFPTEYHLNFFVDNFLSMPGGIDGMFNFFDFDASLKYDEEKKANDIAAFGLLDYSFFEEYMTYEEFSQYPAQYLSVSLGKGLMTEEWLEYLIGRYVLDKR